MIIRFKFNSGFRLKFIQSLIKLLQWFTILKIVNRDSIKAECENLKLEKEQMVRDLSLSEGENENLKSKAWGLERNVTILQSDRSQLEGKIRDLLNASLVTKNSFSTSQNESGIATQEELRACKSKMIQLQGLVKSLIEHTKQKDATLISAFQNSSQV